MQRLLVRRRSLRAFTLIELMIVVSIVAIVAAIAIPNLLQSRMQANESSAIAALKTYATGQFVWKRARYDMGSPGRYASNFTNLSTYGLISPTIAQATSSASGGYQGYYFVNDPALALPADWDATFGLYAYPCAYERSGINAYFVGASGTVLMANQQAQGNEILRDATWQTP